jgi:hypothetical protein
MGGLTLVLLRPDLKFENVVFRERLLVRPTSKSEVKFMRLRWRPRDEIPRSHGRGWGAIGAPSGGIELVLKQISLPVAQIRVICKNGPQVSIDDIKCLSKLIFYEFPFLTFLNACQSYRYFL